MVKKEAFDPGQFNDEVALKTKWNPIRDGGDSLKTHSLKQLSLHKYKFRNTGHRGISLWTIVGVSLLLILSFFIYMIRGLWGDGFYFEEFVKNIGIFLLGLITLIVSLAFLKPIYLDLKKGILYRGFFSPKGMESKKSILDIQKIYALQIVSESLSEYRSENYYGRHRIYHYPSYELNGVFSDGSRFNLLDHGNWKQLHKDAKSIAERLAIPLWDGSQ